MKSQLTQMAQELANRRRERVLPYADHATAGHDRQHREPQTPAPAWRRAGLSTGLALILFGLGIALRGGPEVLALLTAGGLLFGASIPSVGPKGPQDE